MTERCLNKSVDETMFSDIKENYRIITENVGEAMIRSGRKDNNVSIMAVTKTVSTDNINYAESLGIKLLGENRVQEFLGKYEKYSKNSEIHFIGGLQNNKVKYIIDKVSMIHSVDSIKLAQEINHRAANAGRVMDILLEINIAGEDTKGGISPDELFSVADELSELENLRLRGLMTIPPPLESEKYFPKMQELYENAKVKFKSIDTLSMGMSGDYETAIEYGSTIVRIGSGLFGYRNYNKI